MREDAAGSLFDAVEKFAGYSFNKSHSAAYALVAYQTAYLKAHHPTEFLAALLTCDKDDTDKVSHYIAVAKTLGIRVLPPDVNSSAQDFTVVGSAILFGLAGVRNVGETAVEAILSERASKGSFPDLFDFCSRVDLRRVNKRVIESLVKCGAFDGTGGKRSAMFASIDRAVEMGQSAQQDRLTGQTNLFGMMEAAAAKSGEAPASGARYPEIAEWPEKERLAFEKEVLGFYITGHPLSRFAPELKRYASSAIRNIGDRGGREVTLAGIVAECREKVSRAGQRYAIVTLEDLTSSIEVLCYSRVYEAAQTLLAGEDPVLIRGFLQDEGDDENPVLKVRAEEVQALSDVRIQKTSKVAVRIDVGAATPEKLRALKEMLARHGGACDVYLCLSAREGQAILQLPESLRVAPRDELVSSIQETFGNGTVELR
jgi:DNA polymerase-3 subunit alpha